jgi:hypothetical protein
MRTDAVADTLLSTADSWQVRAVPGSKGERRYAWRGSRPPARTISCCCASTCRPARSPTTTATSRPAGRYR